MEIKSNKEEMIFKYEYNDKPVYSIGLSKKDKNGNYINGYMTINFKQGVNLENKTKIKIKDAWLSFYIKDSKTIPTIFINDFEVVGEPNPYQESSIKTETQAVEITDDDLPF